MADSSSDSGMDTRAKEETPFEETKEEVKETKNQENDDDMSVDQLKQIVAEHTQKVEQINKDIEEAGMFWNF